MINTHNLYFTSNGYLTIFFSLDNFYDFLVDFVVEAAGNLTKRFLIMICFQCYFEKITAAHLFYPIFFLKQGMKNNVLKSYHYYYY